MSEKAKLIRGDPPKIDFKKKGEPLKNGNPNFLFVSEKFVISMFVISRVDCNKYKFTKIFLFKNP